MENGNRPANPVNAPDVCNLEIGLTKRELLAGMAMQGLLARNGWCDRISREEKSEASLANSLARASVIMGDKLPEELEKTKLVN